MKIQKTFVIRMSLDIEDAEVQPQSGTVPVHVTEDVPQDYRQNKPPHHDVPLPTAPAKREGIYSVIKPEILHIGSNIPSTVPDAVLSDTGRCLVPLTEGRIAALAAAGQDVTNIRPGVVNSNGFDIDGVNENGVTELPASGHIGGYYGRSF